MSMTEAAGTGDRRRALEELRDTLARAIDVCDSMRDLAALSRQMTDVLAQLEELEPAAMKGTALDELTRRRQGRSAS
jgi:hypothetical protein